MNGEYHLIEVVPEQLHAPEWQPPSRAAASTSIGALARSIATIRLQYPLLVVRRPSGDGYTVVDGNRRLAAIMSLISEGKWRTPIPVLVASSDPAALFASVSGTTRALTATQWVHVHLNSGAVPSGPTKSCITQLEKVMGREFLVTLSDKEMSPQVWNLAGRVIKYLGLADSEKPAILSWLVDKKLSRPVGSWVTQGYDKDELRKAYNDRREPRLTSSTISIAA